MKDVINFTSNFLAMKYRIQIPNSKPQILIQVQTRVVFLLGFRRWNWVFLIGGISLLSCSACKQGQAPEGVQGSQITAKRSDTLPVSLPLYQSPTFLSDATGKTVQITADSTSHDEQFGESYRVLKVFKEVNGKEKEISRRLLPVNASPDFRYRFADVYAKDRQEWVVIQGHYFFFVYDVVNDQLSEEIFPPKPKDFEAADAQSGRIITLAFEDNQLNGTAQDIGAFHFSIAHLRREMSK